MSKRHDDKLKHRDRVLRQARACLRRGWQVVPITQGQKGPRIKGWPKLRLKKRDLPNAFGEADGIGVILGKPSGGLVDVDLDSLEAIAVVADVLTRLAAVIDAHKAAVELQN